MINVIFESEDIVAVDKPEGLAVIPEAEKERVCLQALLQEKVGRRVFVVHRLDKEASGAILFAKNADAHRYLCGQFEQRLVRKTYVLLLHGRLSAAKGLIDAPLRQFGSGRMGVDAARGRPSSTEYSVRQRYAASTLAEARPATGRRHQLRVHFYSIGHPVVGDRRYGEKSLQQGFARLMLHAAAISFALVDGSEVKIEAPQPESFARVLASLA